MQLKDEAQNKTFLRFWTCLPAKACFTILLIFFCGQIEAQKIGVNERGDSIVVYTDGSWRYFDASIDQDLKNGPTATSVSENVVPEVKVKKPKNKKGKKPKSKKPKKPKAKKPKSKKAKAPKKKHPKNKKAKKPKNKKGEKTVQKFTDVEEERFRGQALANASQARQKALNLQRTYEEMTYDRVLLEDELKDAYTAPNTTDEQIVNIESKIQAHRGKEQIALEAYEAAQANADFLEKLIDVSEAKRRKLVAKYEAENSQVASGVVSSERPISTGTSQPAPVAEPTLTKQTLKAKRSLRTASNVYLNPPTRTCPEKSVRFNEFTGKKMITLGQETFFTKTPERMRILLKDRSYLTCEAALANTGGLTFLELELVIASTSAEKAYGLIEKGSKLSIKLISGYTISLNAIKSAPPEVNNLEKTVTFKPRYLLDKTNMKTLEKESIDQVRLVWMTGYEDYEIFDVDFLANQIKCLKED